MKFYTLAMLLLLFNVSLAILNVVDVMGYQANYQDEWIDNTMSSDAVNQSYAPSSAESDDATDYGNFKKGLSLFIQTIFYATIGFPWMFHNFGLHASLCVLFGGIIYVVYIVGLIQLFSKQPFGGMR